MKKMKNFRIIYLIGLITILFSACETYDEYAVERDTVAGFSKKSNNINNVPTGTGNVKSIEVALFVSDVSNVDRQFNIVKVPTILDLTTIPPQVETNPENYSFDSTVTIPANSRTGVITVSGTNISMVNKKEYFSLGVEGSENVISGSLTTIRLKR